jgi:chromosome segregation ATPase
MYHYHHRYPLESDQKDLFISELKAENFELRHRQGAHYEIRENITSTEHEIAIINDERRHIEDDMAARKIEDDRVIVDIKHDNDGYRATLSAKEAEINDLKEQIEALRRQDDDISVSINSVNADLTAVDNHNGDLRIDLPKLEDDLDAERTIGRNLRNDLDKAKASHSSLDHSIRLLEEQLAKNKANEDDLHRILGDREAELSDKTNRLRSLEDEVAKLRIDIDGRDKEVHDLNRRYGLQLDINNKERHELDRQLAKNTDLDLTVRRLEEELIILEKDVTFLRTDVERLTIVLTEATSANHGLEEELEALNRHAQLLESQNVDLTKELDSIVISDQRIRADLDRGHRVSALQHRNDEEMRHSINRLSYNRSVSPVRSISRSPTRRF